MASIFREALGNGPDLVFVHGWGMHSGIWRDFGHRLARNFRVTLLDLPGHGCSHPAKAFSLDQVSIALMENAPPVAHWVGWSLGATLAMNIAVQQPQRVASIVTLAGNAKFVQSAGWQSGIDPSLLNGFSRELARDKAGVLRRFAGLQVRGDEAQRVLLRKLIALQNEYDPPALTILKEGLDILRTADLRQSLVSLRIPGLLLFGANDTLVPAAAGEAMAALWRDAAVQVITGAAHVPFLSHPELCATAITEFIFRRVRY